MANKKIMRRISALLSVCALILLGCPESTDDPPAQYTVTFNPDGGTVSPTTAQVNSGESIGGTLPVPTKTGATFGGWYTAQNGGGTQFTETTPVTGNITVYAKWQYTVTFNPDGGTPAPANATVNSGETLSALPELEKTGFDFVGWFTQNGSPQWGIQFDTVIPITKNITLYARWKAAGTPDPVMYTVTFNAAEGTVDPSSVKVEAGASLGDHLPAAARSGYTFGGWYTVQNGGGTQFTATTPVTANITVYAKWTTGQTAQYTVTFDPAGGTVNPTAVQVNSGETAGTLPAPAKTGYTFGGWYTAQNGGGTQFTATTPVTANITVYAKWTALPSSSGENALSGKTYVDSDIKIVFSSTASSALSGIFTMSTKNWQTVEIATGSYAWNGTEKTVTLTPEKVAEQLNGDEYGPLQTKTEYRASRQAEADQALAEQGVEAVNQYLDALGFSSITEYIDYAVEDTFKNVLHNYAFSADNKALFLDEQLPANTGTNVFAGQTYNGVNWVNDHPVKDPNQRYVFTADSCTYTNGSSTETYRYAYNLGKWGKQVIFKRPTDDRNAAYTAIASNTTNSGSFSNPDEYNAAQVNDRYKLQTYGYNTTEKTIENK
jgi:uncharacterized repeat protein (TIGR02543 family)